MPFLSAFVVPDAQIGLFMTLTLVGDVIISFVLSLYAAMGRKMVLAIGSLMMVGSAWAIALYGNFLVRLLPAQSVRHLEC